MPQIGARKAWASHYCISTACAPPVCCPDGWRIVFAGRRFCSDTERQYAPIEGEAAAIAWALEKWRIFVMGFPQMIVVTDHPPLTGIFGDRDLSKVHNPRLFWLKEKCLRYSFSIQHCPTCATIAPSQPREPIIMTPATEWSFRHIVMDIFHVGHVAYLACADRLTDWFIMYRLKPSHTIASKLMSICRCLFQTYGTPDELSTDCGPPFTSSIFQEFL